MGGLAYRFTTAQRDVREPNLLGARWNPRDVPAVYTALSLDTALAEYARRMEIQSPRPSRGNFSMRSVTRVSIHCALSAKIPCQEAQGYGHETNGVGEPGSAVATQRCDR
ncbi:MAG: RES domain-containing protein, partial [Deltaproteobacteria bacterium]|nr:RES domain-containing protein [Deltaproteobacteria bacterium]